MAEAKVQLPPNSTGQQLRVETGDGTNLMPTGVGAEVVIVSDALGLFAGDARQQGTLVIEQTMQEVLTELRRLTLLLSIAFATEMPSLADAMNLGG